MEILKNGIGTIAKKLSAKKEKIWEELESGKVTTKKLIAAAILSPKKFFKETQKKEQINELGKILESTNFYNLKISKDVFFDFKGKEKKIVLFVKKYDENFNSVVQKLAAKFSEIGISTKIISEEKNDKIQIKL